ncbi:DUF2510 domain-containing protein [Yinghuangia soli]|uniref:DUF2510 domain-containing protein n=1 Tax=Yinghuangia soli TaxID=2908204 RepID=A0AA41PY67_9ACTN|nr:DUF2510 domain-containing protein [Yinghuangia soli]MCF2527928.1 DUF2510 domain-containing protein [Yinghuangia soli]
MTSSIPPGWYDDPAGPGMERWWDGSQWTDSTRPPSGQGFPPAAGPAAMPPAPAGPPPMPVQYGGYPSAPGTSPDGKRNRNIILAVVALLLVGGRGAGGVAARGGAYKKDEQAGGTPTATVPGPATGPGKNTSPAPPPGPATDGTVKDPTTGITVPKLKGWEASTDDDSPALQRKDKIPCEVGASASPDDDGNCYLGEIDVVYVEGPSLSRVVAEVNGDINTNSDYRVVQTVKDEATKADGADAHLLTFDIEENQKDAAGKSRTATMQLVFVDSPFQYKGTTAYPVVFVALYTDPKGPPKAVMDTVRDGIKVGTPQPAST